MSARIRPTRTRVAESTADAVQARHCRQLEANIAYYAARLDQIEQRLKDLDAEWDVERALETNASIVAMAGLGLSLLSRKYLLLPVVVAGFLLQHALQGWCPPLPFLRRLGVRTAREINQERYALKALRGDFRHVDEGEQDSHERAVKAMRAAG